MPPNNMQDHDILIRLDTNLTSVMQDVKEIKETQGIQAEKISRVEISQGTHAETIDTLKKEVTTLRNISIGWSTLNSLAGIILAALTGGR